MNNSRKAPETLKHFPLPRVVWESLRQPPTNTHTAMAAQTHSFMHVVPENTLSAVLAGGCKDFTTKGRLSTALCHKNARQSESLTQAFPEATMTALWFQKILIWIQNTTGQFETVIIWMRHTYNTHYVTHGAYRASDVHLVWTWCKIVGQNSTTRSLDDFFFSKLLMHLLWLHDFKLQEPLLKCLYKNISVCVRTRIQCAASVPPTGLKRLNWPAQG